MDSIPCRCSDIVKQWAVQAGACAVAVARVENVNPEADKLYCSWLERGYNGDMRYLQKYPEIRRRPELLLPGASSMVCCAFAYVPPRAGSKQHIAAYALGCDYHDVLRHRLGAVAQKITDAYGGECRVCVDTAPLRERYWAQKAGLGVIGINNHLIVPGAGSYVLLGEILTTVPLRPDAPSVNDCGRCGQCVKACPAGALMPGGTVDARKCISYLTIEYRGEFEENTDLHGCLYGCDVCASVCPHNILASPPPVVEELRPRTDILALTPDDVLDMEQEKFSVLFRGSAIKRAKLAGLRRNALRLKRDAADAPL